MAIEGTPRDSSDTTLLAPNEPLPFAVLNPNSTAPLLLVCDHASRRFPLALNNMGLDPPARRCHLALDIGAAELTKRLAVGLGVTAVLAQYSRLVVDCNRDLLDPGAFLEFGDGIVVPGNRNLSSDQKYRRATDIYWPYHYAISMELKRLAAFGFQTAFYSIHSFTPVLNGKSRELEVGVLWNADRPTAEMIIDGFRKAGFKVGDNKPYSGKAPQNFTIDYHAKDAQLPHVGIEIRQDLIDDDAGVSAIAAVMQEIIEPVLANSDDEKIVLGPTGS